MKKIFLLALLPCFQLGFAAGFESTKVLPKGIRNFSLTNISTSINTKRKNDGSIVPLSEPLSKDLRFSDLIKTESGMKKKKIEALLLIENSLSTETPIGKFTADMEGAIAVTASIFAYGVTDRLTLAIAVPYYRARTRTNIGFIHEPAAQDFVDALSDKETNSVANAREAAINLNKLTAKLKEKLDDNGYQSLGSWENQGIGDMTLAAKYLAIDQEHFKFAISGGLVFPTGRKDDPDNLVDLPFGDGQGDAFIGLVFDQPLTSGFFLNEFFKYTYQSPGEKPMRIKTTQESLEVPVKETQFKLGDKWELMTSVQYEGSSGLQAGLGWQYQHKWRDRILSRDLTDVGELEKDSSLYSRYQMMMLGYSTVSAYQKGEFLAPLMVSLEYQKQYAGKNIPITHFTQLNLKLYF